MNIIHFYPRASGIKFLRMFQKFLQETFLNKYSFYDNSEKLLSELASRTKNTDIVIFTAHGTEDYIIGDRVKGEQVLLTKERLADLANSFVFAFSCSTGSLGQKLCLEHNVISYVGFNDVIDLVVKSDDSSYKQELSIVLKDIYNRSLQLSFNDFIQKNFDVNQFAKLISLNLKREFSHVLSMESEELIQRFSLSRVVAINEVFIQKLRIDLLTTIDSVSSRIVVHGERNFIPWGFLGDEALTIVPIIDKLKITKFESSNEYYRFFMLAILNLRLGYKDQAYLYYQQAAELFPDYEPLKIFSFMDEGDVLLDDTEVG